MKTANFARIGKNKSSALCKLLGENDSANMFFNSGVGQWGFRWNSWRTSSRTMKFSKSAYFSVHLFDTEKQENEKIV